MNKIFIEKLIKDIPIVLLYFVIVLLFVPDVFNISMNNYVYFILLFLTFLLVRKWYGLYLLYLIRLVINKSSTLPNLSWVQLCNESYNYLIANDIKDFLENENCQIFYNKYKDDYRIRVLDKKTNKCFDIVCNKIKWFISLSKIKLKQDVDEEILITKLWKIFQKYFNEKITYNGIKNWCLLTDKFRLEYPKFI